MTKTDRLLAALRRELDGDWNDPVIEETVTGAYWRFTKRGEKVATLFLTHDTNHEDGRHALVVSYPKTRFVLHVLDGTRHPITVTGTPPQAVVRAMAYAMEV
jgi:hypothetical protein